jgi:hypothetical protein
MFLSVWTVATALLGARNDQLVRSENIAPTLRLEFYTSLNDGSKVRAFFVRFARNQGFSVTDWTSKMPWKDGRPVFNMQLRKRNSTTIKVNNILQDNRYFVFVYESRRDHETARISSQLTSQLQAKWRTTRPYGGQ